MPKRLLLTALLALTLVACGGSDDPGTTGSSGGTVTSGGDAPSLNVEQDLARLLSGDVVLAIRADVAHMRASTLYPKFVELIRNSQNMAENADFTVALLERTEQVAFGGGVDATGPDPHLTAMRGRYDQADFERFAGLRPDAVAATYRGVAMFDAGGESLTLVGGRVFLLGTTAKVHAAIDRLAETSPTPGGVAARLLDDPALAGAPIAVALVAYDELRRKIAEEDEIPRELRSLVGGTATLDLSAGLEATALADVGSEAAATGLERRLRSELSSPAVRIGMSAMGLQGVTSAIRISSQGTSTRVDVAFNPQLLAQIVSVLETLAEQYATDSAR